MKQQFYCEACFRTEKKSDDDDVIINEKKKMFFKNSCYPIAN